MHEISIRPLASRVQVLCHRPTPSMTSTTHRMGSSARPCLQEIRSYFPSMQIHRPWQRSFTTSTSRQDWLTPKRPEKSKSMVGRPRMPTGGSTRGTTVVWGEYGLRMKDHDRRVSAKQLRIGEQTIKGRLRGMRYQLFTRVSANIGVYTKGNEVRMGKGKGKFDYWAARIAVSRIVFELRGDIHEKVVRDAFRLAGNKLPGMWEFVKKGDPPVVGLTKLGEGVTLETLKLARRPVESKDTEPQPIIPAMTDAPPKTISTTVE